MNKLTEVQAKKLTEAQASPSEPKATLGSLNVASVHVRRKSRDEHMTNAIRKATKADLDTIKAWLCKEERETGGGFFCNWSIIDKAFRQGDLIVLAGKGDVVGFVADAASGPDILEIHPNARHSGYGRRLAEWAIAAAFDRGNSVVTIQCAPETSVPFWEKMGFKVSPNERGLGGGKYAHKVLERRFVLIDGPRIPFEIGFYPEAQDWQKDTQPFRTYAGEGLLEDGSLQLPERAICFAAEMQTSPDCVVRIVADGKFLFEDKVKRPEAKSFGVSCDTGYIYYLDKILRLDAGS